MPRTPAVMACAASPRLLKVAHTRACAFTDNFWLAQGGEAKPAQVSTLKHRLAPTGVPSRMDPAR